jgi:16S rRNA (adenine1518-N6/adenine1519-N6)-dimethyltransferase
MEMMDIVNENDEVVGTTSKQEIYEKLLCHRIVHVLVFNRKGELALQLQGAKKKFCPLHWMSTAGGHVQAGETAEQAALREFREETGVSAPLRFLFKDVFVDHRDMSKFLYFYRADYEGPFNVNPEEVAKVEFFTFGRIKEMISAGEKFHPQLLFLLKKHFNF